MEIANMRRSASYQNGDVSSSRKSSVKSASVKHSISFPTSLDLNAVRRIEAADIVEILKKKIAFTSGGCDRNKCLIITIPARDSNSEFTFDELTNTLYYLSAIPRSETKRKFTVVVDTRTGLWSKSKMILRGIQHCLGHLVSNVLLIKPEAPSEKDFTINDIKREKAFMNFSIQCISKSKLLKYIELGHLTSEFGGSLSYNHAYWLTLMVNYEKFLKESQAVIRHLDTIYRRVLGISTNLSIDDMAATLHTYHNLYETAMEGVKRMKWIGDDIVMQLQTDGDSGFKKDFALPQNADLLYCRNQIQKLVLSIKENQERLATLWYDVREKLAEEVESQTLDSSISKVVDWILGSGEKLLTSQVHIGKNFQEADEFRKIHEQLELQCTETFATYAEVRRKIDEMSNENPNLNSDLLSQKEYLDSVCRLFSSRIEKRRNLLITSVRFHRTIQELFQNLSDFDELLRSDNSVIGLSQTEVEMQKLEAAFDNLVSLKDQVMYDGDRLVDLMSMPLKNAAGKDVATNYTSDLMHIKSIQSKIKDKLAASEELRDAKRLRLKQILHLATCERDAQQVIVWILELCSLLVNTHIQVGSSLNQAHALWDEHQKFEETAKGTNQYGCQLLQTALTMRRASRFSQDPNSEISQRLFHAWNTFLMGSAERTMRLKVSIAFFKKSNEVLQRLNELTEAVIAELGQTIPSRKALAVQRHIAARAKLVTDIQETVHIGQMLLGRIPLPVIPEYRSDKDICDHEATREIQQTIAAMESAKHKLDTVMAEGQNKEGGQGNPVSPSKTTQPSSLEDWKTFSSTIPGDDWTSNNNPSAPSRSPTKDKSPLRSFSPFQTGLSEIGRLSPRVHSPLAHYEETKKTTQLKETRISRSASPGNKLMSVSQEKLNEEWKRSLSSSSHVSDKSTSFVEYRESASSPLKTESSSPVPMTAVVGVPKESARVSTESGSTTPSVVRIHPIQLANGDAPKAAPKTDINKILDDEELKNDPLLKHIHESKEWLQLKILEMEPGLTKLGTNLDDALEYQRQHEEVLVKLQAWFISITRCATLGIHIILYASYIAFLI